MKDEFDKARDWVAENLDFNRMSGDVSVFETNIRYVGGLLSAYALTGDEVFREKATHVAEKLRPAFNSPTGIPYALTNMRTGNSKNYGWASEVLVFCQNSELYTWSLPTCQTLPGTQ